MSKDINIDIIAKTVNELQDCFEVVNGGILSIDCKEEFLTDGYIDSDRLIDYLESYIPSEFRQYPVVFIVSLPLKGNLFAKTKENYTVVTTYDWDYFSPPNVKVYLVYHIVRMILRYFIPDLETHRETRGCIKDFCERKMDIKYKLIMGDFCDECRKRIENAIESGKLTEDQFKCLKRILEWISSETKRQIWNVLTKTKNPAKFERELAEILRFSFIKQGYEVEFGSVLNIGYRFYVADLTAKKGNDLVVVEIKRMLSRPVIDQLKSLNTTIRNIIGRFYVATIKDSLQGFRDDELAPFILFVDENLNVNPLRVCLSSPPPIPHYIKYTERSLKAIKEPLLRDRLLIPETLIEHLENILKDSEISYSEKVVDFLEKLQNDYQKTLYELILETINNLIEGRTRLFELFIPYEQLLYNSPNFRYYRDHFIHPFQVFLVGLSILNAFYDEIVENIAKQFSLSEDDAKKVVDFTWLYSSLFHDIGYPLQTFKEWSENFIKTFLGKDVSINIDLSSVFISAENSYSFLHYVDMLNDLFNKLTNQNKTEFRDVIINEFLRNQNHAIVSALALMKMHEEILKSDNEIDKIIIKLSALSIALHDKDIFRQLSTKIRFSELPIAFILIFCDTAQEWGRPYDPTNLSSDEVKLVVLNAESSLVQIELLFRDNNRRRRCCEECEVVKSYVEDNKHRFEIIITNSDRTVNSTIKF